MEDQVGHVGTSATVLGWSAAAVSSLLNVLLGTWRVQSVKEIRALQRRVEEMRREDNRSHTRMYERMDQIDAKIDESRREIKTDLGVVVSLLNGRKQ